MPILRATAVLNMRTGKPDEAARNVWHFDAGAADTDTLTDVANAVGLFYTSLASYFGPGIDPAANACRVDMSVVTPGSPGESDDVVTPLLVSVPFTLGVGTSSYPQPEQVAVCLSFNADLTGVSEESGLTRPRSRRRGRIFLGPLNQTTQQAPSGMYKARVADAFAEAVLDAYDTAHAAWVDDPDAPRHVIYSRADGIARQVNRLRLDESFDTMRRRKVAASSRFTRSITPASALGPRSGTEEPVLAS